MGFSRQDYGNGLPFPPPVSNLHTLSIAQYNFTRDVAILFEAHLNVPILCNFIQILPTTIPLILLSIRIQGTNFGLRAGFLGDFFLLFLFPVHFTSVQFSSVQLLSHVRLFATPWIVAHQASLSITNSRSSLRLTSIKSLRPSSDLILCHPLLLLPSIPLSIRVFSNKSTLRMRWPKSGVSALASVLPMNTQDRSPSEWTVWISLHSKGLSILPTLI